MPLEMAATIHWRPIKMKRTHRESNVEITVRQESSPIVEIVLKNGPMSLFRTTLSFPNMEMAEEYAQYMARGMGETSYHVMCSTGSTVFASGAETARKSYRSTINSVPLRVLPSRDFGIPGNSPMDTLLNRSRVSRRKSMS